MFNHQLRTLVILLPILILNGCAAVAVTGMAAGASVAADTRTTGTVIEDQSIEFKASTALGADEEIKKLTNINTTSYNTIVLITGEAPTEILRQRAVDIVRNIERVSQVHNEITIAAPSSMMSRSSDTLITSRVKTRLLANKEVSGLNTKVVTEKGVVYLMGLSTRSQADKATDIARRTSGVQKVVKLFQYTD
jgi:osmotically-inducible protein OsmY